MTAGQDESSEYFRVGGVPLRRVSIRNQGGRPIFTVSHTHLAVRGCARNVNLPPEGSHFSGQADAAAKATDKGGEISMAATVVDGIELYQFTKAGLALQATLQGTKYWKDKSLN